MASARTKLRKLKNKGEHPNWGGRRAGAGIKPYKDNPINRKFSVAVDDITFQQLEAVAKEKGCSRNSIVHEAIKLHLHGR